MPSAPQRREEAGFTLVESLVAIVVLVFGLIAVTNLLLVAASSNSVANQGTAAAVSASKVHESFRNVSFTNLAAAAAPPPGAGSLTTNVGTPATCDAIPLPGVTYNCQDELEGVGTIVTRWTITSIPGTPRALHIQVRSEGMGVLSRARSRADFTMVRTCTDSEPPSSCPLP